MARATHVEFEFVERFPDELQPATLYISVPFRNTCHLCLCGCGEAIVNPLRPHRWSMTYDGSTVSLAPSVGNNGIACKSHYWITSSQVNWFPSMTSKQTALAMDRDGWRMEPEAQAAARDDAEPERTSWVRRLWPFAKRERRNNAPNRQNGRE